MKNFVFNSKFFFNDSDSCLEGVISIEFLYEILTSLKKENNRKNFLL